MKGISVLMVGIGGFAGAYLKKLLYDPHWARFRITGAVDPYAQRSEFKEELVRRGIPIYDTLEEFYRVHTAQLALLVTPVYLHAQQARYCMEHGSDVLCEKPLCTTWEDAKAMMEARDRTGRKLAVGFQWSFSEGILKWKEDIRNGLYGDIRRIKTIVYFPRTLDYYHRGTGWAGKRRLDSGEWILDSVASNAAAHYLHNMLFLTGDRIDRSAEPEVMEAEVYRANPIEMFDTCALRIRTRDGVELLFYATHAVPKDQERPPEIVMEAEKGQVTLDYEQGKEILSGHLDDGRTIGYERPGADDMRKLFCMASAIRENLPIPCVPETTLPHLKCILALADSFPETPAFPEKYISYSEKTRQYTCKGLAQTLDECWREWKLPGEGLAVWGKKPHEIYF
ncbi:MAG TPA: Gfo/Idh/MocA family oxidoreductase [Candidatus Eisenbergiella merdavium]|uniref:Gfo/Idh/MocA family oxidoreductase n=1 Tax=Candidatus Eisenbergiella merdavium TaxID=2838551 RepID=A0A9D2SP61_9FIRM|nr:Gfo/Idh/MocA family oxidoreductase [Candidatus Eisenbergiella merdavium]